MIKVGDRVVHMGEGYGTVRHIRRAAKRVLVSWDSGHTREHYLPAVKKAAR